MRRATFMNRALFALLASCIVGSVLGESTEPTKIRITTWNLEWFPNGSAHDATPEVQAQRIAAVADVLRRINPDIILLQEVRDYDACARLGEAIAPRISRTIPSAPIDSNILNENRAAIRGAQCASAPTTFHFRGFA